MLEAEQVFPLRRFEDGFFPFPWEKQRDKKQNTETSVGPEWLLLER